MLTPSVLQQTPRFFSDLLESPMTEDWVEKNFSFAMSDYAMFPQTQDDDNNNNKQLLDASTDPQLSCFPASFVIDDLCAKMRDEENDDEIDYEDDMKRDEDLEEIAEAAMIEWNKQQTFPVDLPSANVAEVNRIAKDPWSWTVDDVRDWCDWALRRFRVTDAQRNHLLRNLHCSGNELCQFSVSDFQEHFETSGKYLYAELELWKNVHVISSSESEQKLYDVEAKRDETDGASHTVPGRVPLGFKASTEIAASSVSTHCLQSMSTGLTSISTVSTTSTTTTLSSLTSELLSNRLASTSQPSTSQWNYSTPLEHRIPTFVVDSAPDTPSFENEASARGPLSEYASATAAEEGEGFWGCLDADSGVSLDSDCPSSFDASQKTNPGDSSEMWQPHAKQGNHLWQFLHELLCQPSLYVDCIRWVDRKQGIFKIEDSVHVAKLWGERKNRPAMNYDKLSRSIRQYYKKGIIRKTNQSKRLVYQFCPRYA